MCRKDTEQYNCCKSFSDASNFPDIEEVIIKQKYMLKAFDTEPRNAIPKKHFVSEKENNCKEEINLTSQDTICNMDWCKCRCKCKLMAKSVKSFCLLPRSSILYGCSVDQGN